MLNYMMGKNATNHHGPRIPKLLGHSVDTIQLSVTVESGLVSNKLYTTSLFTCGAETPKLVTEFSKMN